MNEILELNYHSMYIYGRKEMRKNDGRVMLALAINIGAIKASARMNQPSEINENW